MTFDAGTSLIPKTISADDTRTRKIVANIMAVVGVVMILLGLLHTIGGWPLISEAIKNRAINLPSIDDVGVGFHLIREQVINGLLMVGVDRCVFGATLLLCVPELRKGRRSAWRICLVTGFLMFAGYTPLVWIAFERLHVLALVMPAIGLLIAVPLLLTRRNFMVQ